MITRKDLEDFFDENDYDLRKSNNGRWIDQKCTSDVLTVIADCVCNYHLAYDKEFFTSMDIWHHEYTIENVEAIFKKPEVESPAARNEYDKFFQQPLEMLSNARVLIKSKVGNRNYYSINRIDILEYIAIRERNALNFVQIYIQKVLNDSEIKYLFDNFFRSQNTKNFNDLKLGYANFIIQNTKINKKTECFRIFTKVLNPLAYLNNSYGTERGKLSRQIITYDMLMYNRNNFRDLYADKPKEITRKEYAKNKKLELNIAYFRYQSTKAKRFLRSFNDEFRKGVTEYLDGIHINDAAVHIHHIFPEHEFPEISYYLENLIALTPTQHLGYAHPDGRTQEINEQYQHLLLLSKTDRIQENIAGLVGEPIYEFAKMLYVLHVGFDCDEVLDISDMDFESVLCKINSYYN